MSVQKVDIDVFWEIETRCAGAMTKGSEALPNSTLSVYERIMRVYHLDFVYMPTCPLSLSSELAVGAAVIFESFLVLMDNNRKNCRQSSICLVL
jgi:hypothetical protein